MPSIYVTNANGIDQQQATPPVMQPYQPPEINQGEVDAATQVERLGRQLPLYLRDPSAVKDPFERLSAAMWGLGNTDKIDAYNNAAVSYTTQLAKKKAQEDALKMQSMQQRNQFAHEDQQWQNATRVRDWNEHAAEHPEDRAFINKSREFTLANEQHQQDNWPLQDMNLRQTVEGNALDLHEKQMRSVNQAMDKNAIMEAMGRPNLDVPDFGASLRPVYDEAAQGMMIDPAAANKAAGGGIGGMVAGGLSSLMNYGVQASARRGADSITSDLRSQLGGISSKYRAAVQASSGDRGLLGSLLNDYNAERDRAIVRTQHTVDQIVGDARAAKTQRRQDMLAMSKIKIDAQREANAERRNDILERGITEKNTREELYTLNKQYENTAARINMIKGDATGKYDKSAIQGLEEELKNINNRKRALQASNHQAQPDDGITLSTVKEGPSAGSVIIRLPGGAPVLISKDQRNAVRDKMLRENPGADITSDEFNQALVDRLKMAAMANPDGIKPVRHSTGW